MAGGQNILSSDLEKPLFIGIQYQKNEPSIDTLNLGPQQSDQNNR